MPPANQRRVIEVRVNAGDSKQQLQVISDGMKNINKETKKMAGDLGLLSNAFQSFVAYLGVRQLAAFSDEMQNLTNRLSILTGSQQGATDALKQLLELANRTNTSVSDLGEVYTRLGTSLKATKATTEELIVLTEVLTNSFRISGSTTSETSATIVQLSQAFASGTLRGQELRSVMLQNATLAGLLREKFGKNLAADAEKGLISISSVMEVLANNMEKINTSAKKLTPTFEQTVTKGIGQLKFEVGELNKTLGASVYFADLMSSAIKNIGAIAVIVATAAIPILINNVVKLGQTLLAFAVSNPWSAAFLATLTAIVALINYTGDATDTFTQKLFKLQAKFYDFIATMVEVRVKFREATLSVIGFFDLGGKYKNDTDLLQGVVTQYKNLAAEARKNSVELPKGPESDAKKVFDDLIARQKALEGVTEKTKKVKEVLAELNQEYIKGRINAREYGNELVDFQVYKLNYEFSEGKLDLIAYKQKLEELDIQKYNRFLNDGVITLQEYNKMVEGAKIDALNAKVDQGTISLKEYNAELAKISNSVSPGGAFALGTQNYLDSIGTTASQTAAAITSAFTGLETALFEFTKKGTYNFNQFTQAVLDDLLKIIIRASVIQPIAQGLLGFLTPSAANGVQTTAPGSNGQFATPGFANGGVFGSGVKMFASGGIVGAPTAFKYGSNKTGVMGEAGPEAILPLSRGPGGQLGVQASVTPVTINITNNTGADVQAKESTGPSGERQIEILIAAKVKEGLASGTYDKTLQQSYGLKRRGS